jgi:hypothetical protein
MRGVPPSYLAGLSPTQRLLQKRLIQRSQEVYQKTGKVEERPKVSQKKTPRSKHAEEFQERYGFTVANLPRVKREFPDTDVSGILAKGAGAYASSGSRPNVSSSQWKFARLASVLTGGKAYKIDKDLVGEQSRKKIFG